MILQLSSQNYYVTPSDGTIQLYIHVIHVLNKVYFYLRQVMSFYNQKYIFLYSRRIGSLRSDA